MYEKRLKKESNFILTTTFILPFADFFMKIGQC